MNVDRGQVSTIEVTLQAGGFHGDLPAFDENLGADDTRRFRRSLVHEFKATYRKFGPHLGGATDVPDQAESLRP